MVGVHNLFNRARMHAFLVSALSGVLSHVAIFCSVLWVWSIRERFLSHLSGLEGNGTIMGWLSLML